MTQEAELKNARNMSDATGTVWLDAYRTTVTWLLDLPAWEQRSFVRLPLLLRSRTGSGDIFSLTTQICPECLLDSAGSYERQIFRLAVLTCCPWHGLMLIDECIRCRSQFHVGRYDGGRHCTRCGFDLTTEGHAKAASGVVSFQMKLAKRFAPGSTDRRFHLSPPEPLNSLVSPSRRIPQFGFEQARQADRHRILECVAQARVSRMSARRARRPKQPGALKQERL